MKTLLILGIALSASAYAVTCETNFQSAEKALRAGEDVDSYTAWAKSNKCNDELKFASLFASFDGETEEATYSTAKTDLPVIQDARERAPAQTTKE